MKLPAASKGNVPERLLRVPHGWWKPEMERGGDVLSGAWAHANAQVCPDDDDFLDREQGIPHFKGVPCRIKRVKVVEAADGRWGV